MTYEQDKHHIKIEVKTELQLKHVLLFHMQQTQQ